MSEPASFLRLRRAIGRFRQFLLDWPLLAASGLLLAVSLVFLAAPRLDLAFSGFFYRPEGGFGGERSAIFFSVRKWGRVAEWAFALALAAPLLVKFLAPDSRLLVLPRAILFAFATFVLGPGLIVNGILKGLWGRARPEDITDFGGDASFSPVWWISDQCGRNCAFASGEAASAFWLVTLAFIVPRAWRLPIAAGTLAFAAAVSFTRVATGGHFVSDVLVAWLLTLLVAVAMHRIVLKGLPPQFDSAVEAAIGRWGRALRRWWAARGDPTPG
jgi:membrane-associated PAP2 superfamily phosphatase